VLVIVKTGSAEAAVRARRGDFEEWIAEHLRSWPGELRVVDVGAGRLLPEPETVAGAVVTGSPAFVSEREPWSVRTGDWLARLVAASVPVLGICYGHQLLAQALGGRVGSNPRGREIGTVRVDVRAAARVGDPLLGGLPETIEVQATHLESVLEPPPGAVLLGSNEADPHHAVSYGPRAWGLQFHPEFDADVMRGYLSERAERLIEEGLDPVRLTREARDSPHGAAVLRRFAEIVREPPRSRGRPSR
jgi:GMP synthase (glutamine-hydrolysing)